MFSCCSQHWCSWAPLFTPFVSPQFILCLVHVEAAAGSVAPTNSSLRHHRVGTCRVPWPQPRAGVGSGCLSHQVTGAQPGLCFLSIYQPDECPWPLQGSCQGEGCRPWPAGVGLAHGRALMAFRAAMTSWAEPSPVCQQRMVALCCWRGQAGSLGHLRLWCWGDRAPLNQGSQQLCPGGQIQTGSSPGCSLLALPCAHCSHVEALPRASAVTG